ncbi:MAG TPA: hypothetical protein VL326_21990 [Kofleriaceae bacterium]|nr:hypothetical protein [Kofleriaceae bacterium]
MGWARGCCFVLIAALASCGRYGFTPGDDPSGDGGVLGDGRRDGLGDGGGNGLCPAFAILCEDFESGLTQWPMSEIVGPSTTMITTVRPHTGTHALESTTNQSGSAGVAGIIAPIGAHSTGVIAARLWVNATVPIENFDLVISLGDALNDNYTTVGGNGVGDWVVSEARTSAGTVDTDSTTATKANQWVCVEVVFTFTATAHFDVFVDGTQVVMANARTPIPTYDTIRVGAVRGDNLGFHVFTDDVAVATQRIGCN